MLPFNQPPAQPNTNEYPDYLITWAKNYIDGTYDASMQKTTKNRNVWIPASLYWDNRQYLNLAYLPYFSNCNGYG